jgi:hypothetical protein
MDDPYDLPSRPRTDFALRERRRALESREYTLMIATLGMLAYSAFGNLVGGAGLFFDRAYVDGVFSVVLGGLYVFALYRLWFKNDRRWWVVALPAGVSVLLLAACWIAGLGIAVVPLSLNLALLALIPLRARIYSQLQEFRRAAREEVADAGAAADDAAPAQ